MEQTEVWGMPVSSLQQLIKARGFIPKEETEQVELACYLDMMGLKWFHCPNGGARNKIVAAKLKAQGVKAGVPDIIITDAPPLHPCAPGVVIELKRLKGGVVSEEQKNWLSQFESRGWIVKVCQGAGEAVDFLNSLGFCRLFTLKRK